jgi:hypothetical protein
MPTPGARYALFLNSKWIGGMDSDATATPDEVSRRFLQAVTLSR